SRGELGDGGRRVRAADLRGVQGAGSLASRSAVAYSEQATRPGSVKAVPVIAGSPPDRAWSGPGGGLRLELRDEPVCLAAAGQGAQPHGAGVLGQQLPDPWAHGRAVAPDVADEVPGEPVVDSVPGVLATAVAQPAPRDPGQAGDRGQVQEDHG